jgi:hypothetical protein
MITKNKFSKALNFIIIGFLVFFFFSSFRGRVQAQWIVPISIPLILITFNFLIDKENSRKWFVRLAFINIAIIMVARVFMFSEDLSPKKLNMHGNKAWALELQSNTKGQDKIFINSYQNTAAYWYYTKEKAFYMKNFTGRNNHFVMLQENKDLSAREAALVSRIRMNHTDFGTHIRGRDSVFTTIVSDYKDLTQLEINFIDEEIVLKKNELNTITVEIKNNFDRAITSDDFQVYLGFQKDKKKEKYATEVLLTLDEQLISGKSMVTGTISFQYTGLPDPLLFPTLGIGITNSEKNDIIRVSKLLKYSVKE